MACSINSLIKIPFGNLTSVNFGKEADSLEFEFIESAASIRFSYSSDLIEKIKELSKTISYSSDRVYGYYRLPAKDSKIFFKAIELLQGNQSKICVPKHMFQEVLHSLLQHNYITSLEVETLQRNIQTSLTLKEYEEETERTSDARKAMSLVHYYSNTQSHSDNNKAIHWLCAAKRYLGKQSLSTLIDIDKFLLRFNKICLIEAFGFDDQEIAEAIARCPSIKGLYFPPATSYDDKAAKLIGSFLSKATFITGVSLASNFNIHYGRKLNSITILPIANALRTNKSIEYLDLSDTNICDAGVLELIEAIASNPDSKITSLNLFACGMTDKSAVILIELLNKKQQITWVNIGHNNIGEHLVKELNQICSQRKVTKVTQD